jgi:hypothetical protein
MSKIFKKIGGVWTEQTPWSKIWKKINTVWTLLYTSVFTLWSGVAGGASNAPYGISLSFPMATDFNLYKNSWSYADNYYNSPEGILYLKCVGDSDINEVSGKEIKIINENIINLSASNIDLTPFTYLNFEISAQTYTNNYGTISGGSAYFEVVKVSDGMVMASWYLAGGIITRGVYSIYIEGFNYPSYIRVRTYGRGSSNGIEMSVYKVWLT